MIKRLFIILALFFLIPQGVFAHSVVNVYTWGDAIPAQVIRDFEQKTGIKVNFSTYDSNETMYAKLRASKQSMYDVILPSAYFVERMQKKGMLTALEHQRLPNRKHLSPLFSHQDYDPGNHYSMPLIWSSTGIFYNQKNTHIPPHAWHDLWDKRWLAQLMLLDDSREIVSIGLMQLGYSPNDTNPQHIKKAFDALLTLIPNIKLFGGDGIQSMIIDGDAILGTAWSSDAFKAHAENAQIAFVYPEEGFLIAIDCLAIPRNPPHLNEAYAFINFLLEPHVSVRIAMENGYAITNATGIRLLPEKIRNNAVIYPSQDTLKRAHVQRDVGEETIALYNTYWQAFKLAF